MERTGTDKGEGRKRSTGECGRDAGPEVRKGLLQEGEEDGENQAGEGCEMVPVEGLSLEDEQDDYREDRKGDHFLDDLELDEVERTAVLGVTDAVGRDGEAVLEEGDAPGEQDDQDERPARRNLHFTEF